MHGSWLVDGDEEMAASLFFTLFDASLDFEI